MRCEHCHGILMSVSSRTVLDDSGSLAITAWPCARCGGVTEEIRILSRYGKAQPRRVRYAVAPFVRRGKDRLLVHGALTNTWSNQSRW